MHFDSLTFLIQYFVQEKMNKNNDVQNCWNRLNDFQQKEMLEEILRIKKEQVDELEKFILVHYCEED